MGACLLSGNEVIEEELGLRTVGLAGIVYSMALLWPGCVCELACIFRQ